MTKLWTDNPNKLIEHCDEFIPSNKYDLNRNINAITRFSLYGSVLCGFVCKNKNVVFVLVFIVCCLTIYGMEKNSEQTPKPNPNPKPLISELSTDSELESKTESFIEPVTHNPEPNKNFDTFEYFDSNQNNNLSTSAHNLNDLEVEFSKKNMDGKIIQHRNDPIFDPKYYVDTNTKFEARQDINNKDDIIKPFDASNQKEFAYLLFGGKDKEVFKERSLFL